MARKQDIILPVSTSVGMAALFGISTYFASKSKTATVFLTVIGAGLGAIAGSMIAQYRGVVVFGDGAVTAESKKNTIKITRD